MSIVKKDINMNALIQASLNKLLIEGNNIQPIIREIEITEYEKYIAAVNLYIKELSLGLFFKISHPR